MVIKINDLILRDELGLRGVAALGIAYKFPAHGNSIAGYEVQVGGLRALTPVAINHCL